MPLRLLCLTLLLMPLSGCGDEIPRPADPPKVPAICDGSRAARAELADALADTPEAVIITPWGERIVLSGAALVDILDVGCET